MDNYTTTWADADAANKAHYGRGYPLSVHKARIAHIKASQMYDNISELYERGVADIEEVNEALQAYLHVVGYYERVYARWMDGTLAVDRIDLLAEAEGERLDRESLRLP